MLESSLIILLLIATSAFFATSEIALAAARKLKLEQLAEDGDARANVALALQAHPGHFFTTIQIGLNAVAILAGILGEGAYAPYFAVLLEQHMSNPELAGTIATVLSFLLVTSVFILFADLVPKRIAIVAPERIALRIHGEPPFVVAGGQHAGGQQSWRGRIGSVRSDAEQGQRGGGRQAHGRFLVGDGIGDTRIGGIS